MPDMQAMLVNITHILPIDTITRVLQIRNLGDLWAWVRNEEQPSIEYENRIRDVYAIILLFVGKISKQEINTWFLSYEA